MSERVGLVSFDRYYYTQDPLSQGQIELKILTKLLRSSSWWRIFHVRIYRSGISINVKRQ